MAAARSSGSTNDVEKGPREFCSACGRPASVCLCALLPSQPVPSPCEVVLFQHPKERRQKNRSGWIAERCIARVSTVTGRRLAERDAAPAALQRLWDEPEACAVVFPSDDCKPLREVSKDVKLLLFLDATWRFAQEMLRSSPALAAIVKVELQPPQGACPQFVVRKPVKFSAPVPSDPAVISRGDGDRDGDGDGALASADCPPGAEEKWGFCTAEAVALAVDAVNAAREGRGHNTLEATGPAWDIVGAVVRGHVELQLSRTREVRHRPERPGYLPGLYEQYSVASTSTGADAGGKQEEGVVMQTLRAQSAAQD